MAWWFGLTTGLAFSAAHLLAHAQTVDQQTCAELESTLALSERYGSVYAKTGDADKHLSMRERAIALRRSMRQSECGDIDKLRSDRFFLVEVWKRDSAGKDWPVLGDVDEQTRLHYLISDRSGDAISAWIILNKPGPTAPGTTSPSYKSSAELIVTGCSADSYMSRGSIQFGGGSATGFATAIIPYGRPVLRSIKPLSLLAKIGRMACEEDADTNRSQKL